MNKIMQAIYNSAKFLLTILLVVALGLFVVNQFYDYHYKNYFLQKPCGLCFELNPDVKIAFESYYTPKVNQTLYEIYNNNIEINFSLLQKQMNNSVT